jgi:DNA-binding MarR family transcriptional regulator
LYGAPSGQQSDVTRIAKNLPVYTAYAHAVIEMDRAGLSRTLEILNQIGTTRRGLPGKHFRFIANEYETRVREGDKAPITSIAEAHDVKKSTASGWVKEAKRRGYIKEGENA